MNCEGCPSYGRHMGICYDFYDMTKRTQRLYDNLVKGCPCKTCLVKTQCMDDISCKMYREHRLTEIRKENKNDEQYVKLHKSIS